MESFDLIIVGAGVSGLSAAHHLAKNQKSALLLEASDRIGGRIHTIRPQNCVLPVELGAEFVHGEPPQSFALIHRARLPYTEWSGKFLFWEKGKIKASDQLWEKVDKLEARLRPPKEKDISWRDAVEKLPKSFTKAIELGSYFIQGFHGADPSLISLRALKAADDSDQAEKSFRLITGYDSFLHFLTNPQPEVRFRHQLTKVNWKKGKVILTAQVEGKEKEFSCQKLLITIPLSRFKSLSFEPRLPAKEKALNLLEMGLATRVTLDFREIFWDPKMTLLTAPGLLFPTWWTQEPIQMPRLVAWAGYGSTILLAEKSESEVLDLALTSAAKIFKSSKAKLESQLEGAHYHNWTKDPHIQGAYSYVKTGGASSQKALGKSVDNTLFFAGEACHHRGAHATVEGALETGIWAAKEILKASRE